MLREGDSLRGKGEGGGEGGIQWSMCAAGPWGGRKGLDWVGREDGVCAWVSRSERSPCLFFLFLFSLISHGELYDFR